MSNVLCRLGVHDWNKYGELVKAHGGLTQFRSCKRCNRIAYASCYGNQATADDANKTPKKESTNN